jgi:hypothetical protein
LAPLEAPELDERYARCVNDNLADYLLSVNADRFALASSIRLG